MQSCQALFLCVSEVPLLHRIIAEDAYLCVRSGPLAGAVCRFLDAVAHPGCVAAAVELHGAPLQPRLPAALAEASVCVDVVVVDAGGWALPIT